MRLQAFLPERLDGPVERFQMLRQVRADDGRLEPGVSAIGEQIRVAVAVPPGDAQTAEELDDGIGHVLTAHDRPRDRCRACA